MNKSQESFQLTKDLEDGVLCTQWSMEKQSTKWQLKCTGFSFSGSRTLTLAQVEDMYDQFYEEPQYIRGFCFLERGLYEKLD